MIVTFQQYKTIIDTINKDLTLNNVYSSISIDDNNKFQFIIYSDDIFEETQKDFCLLLFKILEINNFLETNKQFCAHLFNDLLNSNIYKFHLIDILQRKQKYQNKEEKQYIKWNKHYSLILNSLENKFNEIAVFSNYYIRDFNTYIENIKNDSIYYYFNSLENYFLMQFGEY